MKNHREQDNLVATIDPAHPERQSPQPFVGWLWLTTMGWVAGALFGACFGAYDAIYHGPSLLAADVFVAIAMAGLIGLLLFASLAVLALPMVAIVGPKLTCSAAVGGITGVGLVTLIAAVVLEGMRRTHDFTAIIVIASAAVVGVVAGRWVAGHSLSSRPVSVMAFMVMALASVLLAACGIAVCRHWNGGVALGLLLLAIIIVGNICLIRVIRSRPHLILSISLLALVGLSVGFARVNYRFASPVGPPAAVGDQPLNVVLIVLDTTRRDRMGCYGNTDRLTPVFDALASDSVVYEDAYSPSPWTMPSHASMFTGLHPVSHGCSYEHHAWLDDDFDTLAELLSNGGYQTWSLISNFYLGRSNMMQGFDRVGFMDRTYENLALHAGSRVVGMPAIWADQGAGETARSLDQWFASEFEPDQPLFLFVNLFEAHEPYIPPYAQRAEHLPPDVGFWAATELALSFDPFEAHVRRSRDERAQSIVTALYEAEIAYQDQQLGRLLNVLENHIELDHTLLIVTADHGENLGDAGRWEHLFSINDDLIHVPLLIRYPARFKPGARVSGLCQIVDIFGTVLDVTGAKAHGDKVEGEQAPTPPPRSLAPDRFEAQPFIYAQVSPFPMVMGAIERNRGFRAGVYGFTDHKRVIHDGRNKLVWSSEGDHRLYDVVADPLELIDQSADDPATLERLMAKLAEWREAQPPYVRKNYSGEIDPLDEEAAQRLRDIGYVK